MKVFKMSVRRMLGHSLWSVLFILSCTVAVAQLYQSAIDALPSWPSWTAILVVNIGFTIVLGMLFGNRMMPYLSKRCLKPSEFYPAFFVVVATFVLVTATFLLEPAELQSQSPQMGDQAFLLASITVIPVVEEILFRGFLLKFVSQKFTEWMSIYIVAVVFGFMHSLPTLQRVMSFEIGVPLGAFLLGLITGYMVRKGKNLWPAIAFHCACNATVLLFGYFAPVWMQRLSLLYH
jgi:membrane protease YdiL (CAAX protease family)